VGVVSSDGSRLATFVDEFTATQLVSSNARLIVITLELVFSTYDSFSPDASLAVSKRRFADEVSASIFGNSKSQRNQDNRMLRCRDVNVYWWMLAS
jgi:hypothetical protein